MYKIQILSVLSTINATIKKKYIYTNFRNSLPVKDVIKVGEKLNKYKLISSNNYNNVRNLHSKTSKI
jgi:Sec7-like guanine-nucleotide exchange factor